MEEASDETDTESVESFGAQLVEAFERQKRKAEEAAEAVELAKRQKIETREKLKIRREEAGAHTAFCGEVRLEKAVDGDGWKHVSSFGRNQTQFGARYFVTPDDDGYGFSQVKGVSTPIPVHTIVNVLFNDPGLRTYERGMTTDHFDQNRANNYKGNLAFKTHAEQRANQTISEASKLNKVKALGHAVQGQVVHPDGTRGEWQTWDAKKKAAEGTMMGKTAVRRSIKKDCVVQSAQTGIEWYFRPLQREEPDGSVWTRHRAVPGVEFDLARGVYRWDGCAETKGSKRGSYRDMEIDGHPRKVHDVLGELIYGPRPSDEHTMEHVDKTLDADGCLSNAASNLGGWFSKKEQAATQGNNSMSETTGKPVAAKRKSDGALLGPWANADLAAEELGWSLSMISKVCNGTRVSTDYEIWFVPQPDLLRVTATTTVAPDGRVKLTLTPEREVWKRINPKDWMPGGKYHRILADNKSTGKGKRLPGLLSS